MMYVITSRVQQGDKTYEVRCVLCKYHFEREAVGDPLTEDESLIQTDAAVQCDHCTRGAMPADRSLERR